MKLKTYTDTRFDESEREFIERVFFSQGRPQPYVSVQPVMDSDLIADHVEHWQAQLPIDEATARRMTLALAACFPELQFGSTPARRVREATRRRNTLRFFDGGYVYAPYIPNLP